MKRRQFLALMGGGVVLAATGGALAFANTRTPTKALEPWSLAGGAQYSDPRLRALSFAVLAPNPHNRQPWLVELAGNDAIRIFFDIDKQLPHTDPLDRQLTIGFGCFLELLTMAANASGYRVETALFPDGSDGAGLDGRPIAFVQFFEDATQQADPLFDFVFERRSTKEPFDTERPVQPSMLQPLLASGRNGMKLGGTVAEDEISYWRDLTADAFTIELETPHTYKESVDLFRIGKAEINDNPDGIDLGGPLIEGLALAGLFSRESALDPTSTGFQEGKRSILENCMTGMGYVWMVSETNTREDQINAGADWLRVNLACAQQGIAFQPMSQALQEYPEMGELYRTVHDRLAPGGGTVQMLARIGYASPVNQSPRWPIESKLLNGQS
ncbi:MAG: twin-arginine translocation pathway signal protein [Pseudomonadota bacterium]